DKSDNSELVQFFFVPNHLLINKIFEDISFDLAVQCSNPSNVRFWGYIEPIIWLQSNGQFHHAHFRAHQKLLTSL
ncbi:MAG: hypothetical protein ACYCZO_15300, partial [Daejeonella sp.]